MSVSFYPAETNGQTVTSWIPLTTVWPSSEGCASSFRLNGPSLMAWDPGYGLDINTNVVCDPPAVTTWWEQGLLGGGGSYHTVVSIGPLICPEDFSTVVSSVQSGSSTLAMCCPSGYYLANGVSGRVTGDCLSDVSSGMTLTYASTPSGDSTAWSIVTTTLSDSSTVGAIAVMGWNIASPTAELTLTSSSDTTSTTTSTSVSSGSTSPSPSQVPLPGSASNDLATGSKIGIGVGVGVGAIGVIALVLAFYLSRRQTKAPAAAKTLPEQPVELSRPAHELGLGAVAAELPGKTRSETMAELGDYR